MIEITNLAPTALLAFGVVWVVGLRVKLTGEQKFWASAAVVFILGFIPTDLGSEIANRVKDAIAVAGGLTGLFQGAKRITGNA